MKRVIPHSGTKIQQLEKRIKKLESANLLHAAQYTRLAQHYVTLHRLVERLIEERNQVTSKDE